MIKYFEENPEALQITNNMYGEPKAKQRIWIELTHKLNDTEGPLKPSFKWTKCWNDMIIYTENRVQKFMTGEDTGKLHRGPNDVERRMLILLGKEDILKYWEESATLFVKPDSYIEDDDEERYDDELSTWTVDIKVCLFILNLK